MSREFPEFAGKVVSWIDVEHYSPDGGTADIKAVQIQFNDGSRIKLEPHMRSQGDHHNAGTDAAGITISMVGSTLPLK